MRSTWMKCLLAAAILAPAMGQRAPDLKPVEEADFGKLADGTLVKKFTLHNAKGLSASIITFGATITGVEAPDRDGKMASVVLGTDNLAQYQRGYATQAQTIGRVANRIGGATFTIDGTAYHTDVNNGPNTLHSGRSNFGQRVWDAKILDPKPHEASVQFTIASKDGDGGFPGNLTASVTFTLTDDNELRLDYQATTDKPTPVNLTNHAFFNLAGSGSVLDQELWIDADKYTVADNGLVPTGEIGPVKDKPFDFTKPTPIGARIGQLGGRAPTYDHSFVLNSGGKRAPDGSLPIVARATDPKSGRTLEVRTDQPGVQLYTGNAQHPGFCLETQHFPDSMHHDNFPPVILRPGETFKSTTVYAFSAK